MSSPAESDNVASASSDATPPNLSRSSHSNETTPLLLTVGVTESRAPVVDLCTTPAESIFTPTPAYFQLYPVRYYVLVLFSVMALFNNMLCYTFASVHRASHRFYFGDAGNTRAFGLSALVSCFFISYIICSFPATWLIERYGLKTGVLCGAWLQACGCLIRVVATPWTTPHAAHEARGSLELLFVGQVVISIGQAFFVNPPPLLAATWFGVNERTFATTIAVNANTLGIAAAYLLGPAIVSSTDDLPVYVFACFGLTLATALLATAYFPSRPPTPPSHSQSAEPAIESSPEGSSADHVSSAVGVEVGAGANADTPFSSDTGSPAIGVFSSAVDEIDSDADSEEEESESDLEDPRDDRIDRAAAQQSADSSHRLASGARSSRSAGRVRTRSVGEEALVRHYESMSSPPCAFVVASSLAEERAREKASSHLLASWRVLRRMIASSGFAHALLAFGVAEAIINAISAFMNDIVDANAMGASAAQPSMRLVGFLVCAFIAACMVGSAVVGFIVDRTKAFRAWIVASLIGSGAAMIALANAGGPEFVWIAVISLGLCAGPIQPLAIETAVEVTFPAPESSVTAVQQVLGNLFSAALFPLILLCRDPITDSMTPALYLMCGGLLAAAASFITFDGVYKRLAHEKEKERAHRELHRRMHEARSEAARDARREAVKVIHAAHTAANATSA